MITMSIKSLLTLRAKYGDRVAMDYLSLASLLHYAPGLADSKQLREAWGVAQSNVSRRVNHLARVGLIDVSNGCGAYQIHALRLL
jgi:Mn-dependent DtxR family transcriptional regulator